MRFALAFALLLAFSASAYAVKEIEDASRHNAGIAGILLDLGNHCGFPLAEIADGNVFSAAGMRAVSLIPQAGNATSDRASPQLLWSIAAQYPASAAFRFPPTEMCSGHPTTLEVYNPGRPRLEGGRLEYRYGSSENTVQLGLDGPNPVKLELDRSKVQEEDFEALFAVLSVRLSGRISVEYEYKRTVWIYICRPAIGGNGEVGGTYCGCESEVAFGTATYSKDLEDHRNFSVENGPVQEFWVNPPLEKRLDGSQMARVLFFARRIPSKISASADGLRLGYGEPYKYNVSTGSCGEQVVEGYFSPTGSNMGLSAGNKTVFPFQLVEKNASYLPFYAEFEWNESAGERRVQLSFEDRFSGEDNFSRNFSVRKPSPFSSESGSGALAIRRGSSAEAPAAYPTPQKHGQLPRFSELAGLFILPFALGAIGIVGWLARLCGK